MDNCEAVGNNFSQNATKPNKMYDVGMPKEAFLSNFCKKSEIFYIPN